MCRCWCNGVSNVLDVFACRLGLVCSFVTNARMEEGVQSLPKKWSLSVHDSKLFLNNTDNVSPAMSPVLSASPAFLFSPVVRLTCISFLPVFSCLTCFTYLPHLVCLSPVFLFPTCLSLSQLPFSIVSFLPVYLLHLCCFIYLCCLSYLSSSLPVNISLVIPSTCGLFYLVTSFLPVFFFLTCPSLPPVSFHLPVLFVLPVYLFAYLCCLICTFFSPFFPFLTCVLIIHLVFFYYFPLLSAFRVLFVLHLCCLAHRC